jgi:lipoprotein signal peptidase
MIQRQSDILYRCLLVGSTTFLLDQLSKFIAKFFVPMSINTGISFGLLSADHPLSSTLLLMALGVLVVFVIQKYWHEHPIATGLFLGGAISNITDRIRYGGVRDWMPLGIFSIRNNLADWAICIAAAMVVIALLRESSKTSKKSRSIK